MGTHPGEVKYLLKQEVQLSYTDPVTFCHGQYVENKGGHSPQSCQQYTQCDD